MHIFNQDSTRRRHTPWGVEVKKRLFEKSMKQIELVSFLRKKGYGIDKVAITQLLYGVGVKRRTPEIAEINKLLRIPYEK